MNGATLLAFGVLCLFATAPGIPLLALDMINLHAVEGRATIDVGPCARDRAWARCIASGGCNVE